MLDIKKGMQFPVLGAAYYPEDWDEAEQDRDIASMQKAGLGCVRIGEFSWHKMEPSDGAFDFAWLHRVVDKLEAAGIGVILGTPSATPPIWLEEKDPTIREAQRILKDSRFFLTDDMKSEIRETYVSLKFFCILFYRLSFF